MCVSEVYSVFRRCRSPGNIKSNLHNIFRTLKQIKTLKKIFLSAFFSVCLIGTMCNGTIVHSGLHPKEYLYGG